MLRKSISGWAEHDTTFIDCADDRLEAHIALVDGARCERPYLARKEISIEIGAALWVINYVEADGARPIENTMSNYRK